MWEKLQRQPLIKVAETCSGFREASPRRTAFCKLYFNFRPVFPVSFFLHRITHTRGCRRLPSFFLLQSRLVDDISDSVSLRDYLRSANTSVTEDHCICLSIKNRLFFFFIALFSCSLPPPLFLPVFSRSSTSIRSRISCAKTIVAVSLRYVSIVMAETIKYMDRL